MAEMIPDIMMPTKSPGEPKVFERLYGDRTPEGWLVFHSLDLAEHTRQVRGEVDFVIVVPSVGVLCLEVKGHSRVVRDAEGLWHLGQEPPTQRSPMKQAEEATESLRSWLKKKDPGLAGVLFFSAVCFTEVAFSYKNSSPEWRPWQIIDLPDFDSKPLHDLVMGVLLQARKVVGTSATGRWFDPQRREPTSAQMQKLKALLRGKFEVYQSPKARQQRLDEELRHFTEMQQEALDQMKEFPRAFFQGPAGTGKSMLALEAARRAIVSGNRTALICFNALLADHLRLESGPLPLGSYVGTLHALMRQLANVDVPTNAGPEFWSTDLPQLAWESILADRSPTHLSGFDVVIVDEAQDLLREGYLDVLDALLGGGGLSRGSWRFFGDLERQALYTSSISAADLLASRDRLLQRGGVGGIVRLDANCRNTPRVATFATSVSGMSPYRSFRRADDRRDVDLRYYASPTEAAALLEQVLDEVLAERYRPSDITLLSPYVESTARRLAGSWPNRLREWHVGARVGPLLSTIQAFKGLESPVVVITDIDQLATPDDEALLYVGATRATDRLYVLANRAVERQIRENVLRPTL